MPQQVLDQLLALSTGVILAICTGAWRKYGRHLERLTELAQLAPAGSAARQQFEACARDEAARLARRVTSPARVMVYRQVVVALGGLGTLMVLLGVNHAYLTLKLFDLLRSYAFAAGKGYATGEHFANQRYGGASPQPLSGPAAALLIWLPIVFLAMFAWCAVGLWRYYNAGARTEHWLETHRAISVALLLVGVALCFIKYVV